MNTMQYLPEATNDRVFALIGSPWSMLAVWLVIINVVTFLVFGLDKWKAKRKVRREQVRRVPDHKKYISSRNLLRVEPKDRIAMSEAEVRVPKGGVLLFREAYHPGLSQYIRYILPENRRKRPPGRTGKTE